MTGPLSLSQQIVRATLILLGLLGLTYGTLQITGGQPETTPGLDNVHRFLAGVYLGTALIALWAGVTIRRQGRLVHLLALAALLGGIGRLISMGAVGIPDPPAQWLAYLVPELLLPIVLFLLHRPARDAP
jgi:hypothetical protein